LTGLAGGYGDSTRSARHKTNFLKNCALLGGSVVLLDEGTGDD